MEIKIIHEYDSTQDTTELETLERNVEVTLHRNLSILLTMQIDYNQEKVNITSTYSIISGMTVLEEETFYDRNIYPDGHTIDFDNLFDELQKQLIRKAIRNFDSRGYEVKQYLPDEQLEK